MNIARAFLELAERQIAAPVKTRHRAAEKRAEKALAERDKLFTIWRKGHRAQRKALLTGPHREPACDLLRFLKPMTLADGAALVSLIKRGPWQQVDADVRFEILMLIDDHVAAMRERHGLPEFDDPLPGAPPNAFLIIRELLT